MGGLSRRYCGDGEKIACTTEKSKKNQFIFLSSIIALFQTLCGGGGEGRHGKAGAGPMGGGFPGMKIEINSLFYHMFRFLFLSTRDGMPFNVLTMRNKSSFRIESCVLIPPPNVQPPVVEVSGKIPIFIGEETPGDYEFEGARKTQGKSIKPDGWTAWIHVQSEQVKARGMVVWYQGRQIEIAVVEYALRYYSAPWRLDHKEHAEHLLKIGFSGAMNPKQWQKALQWKGLGSLKAATQFRKRWTHLQNNHGPNLPKCPNVIFPERTEKDMEKKEAANEWIEVMRKELEDVKARLALLEFQP